MSGYHRQPRGFAQQTQLNMKPFLGHKAAQSVRPFDHGESRSVEIFQQAKILDLRFIAQPIEIQVIERQPPRIFVQEAEGGAGYIAGFRNL